MTTIPKIDSFIDFSVAIKRIGCSFGLVNENYAVVTPGKNFVGYVFNGPNIDYMQTYLEVRNQVEHEDLLAGGRL